MPMLPTATSAPLPELARQDFADSATTFYNEGDEKPAIQDLFLFGLLRAGS